MEYVLLGRDNTVDLSLEEDGVGIDLENATKITATFGTFLVTSTDKAAGLITWDQPTYAAGEIRLGLGGETIPVGTYQVPIIVYDSTNVDGIQWKKVDMKVIADEEG